MHLSKQEPCRSVTTDCGRSTYRLPRLQPLFEGCNQLVGHSVAFLTAKSPVGNHVTRNKFHGREVRVGYDRFGWSAEDGEWTVLGQNVTGLVTTLGSVKV